MTVGSPPFLVVADLIGHKSGERQNPGVYSTGDKDSHELRRPVGGDVKDFRAKKLVYKHAGVDLDYVTDYVSSCRDLMCFYTICEVCVYSPSAAQYLRFDCKIDDDLGVNEFRAGLVYLASINAYKVVLMEFLPSFHSCRFSKPPSNGSVRFTAITVNEEKGAHRIRKEHDDYLVAATGGGIHKVEDTSSSPWELIGEYALPSRFGGTLGNLIGVDGFAYAIVLLRNHTKFILLSLDLETLYRQPTPLDILSLPPCCDDYERNKTCREIEDDDYDDCENDSCRGLCITTTLSQVKDLLCYPHRTPSAIDLWLLGYHPDSKTRTWFKAYSINFTPPPYGHITQLVYFPLRPTRSYDDDDNDDWAGLFIFTFNHQLYQYDVRTKESGLLLRDAYVPKVHVPTGYFFPLKNGLRCTSLPPLSETMPPHLYQRLLHRPPRSRASRPPQLSHPPPPPPPQRPYLLPFPQVSYPPPSSPPPPPPPGTVPPHRHSLLPPRPPLHSHTSSPQVSYPPPPAFDPQHMYSPEFKRRKLHP